MATRALLLSGDEQTVQVATQVLKELDFAFEHSSEQPFGTNTLAHQHFDVILVDCDNKESATPVFNCLRGSTLNQTSITIAIVNGQAGVPDALRLGANLVLTKPVSLEQAKGTLRRALGALRKEARSGKASPANAAAAPVRTAVPATIVSRAISHEEAQGAHAANPLVLPPQLPHSDAVDSPAGEPQAMSSALPNSRSTASSAPPVTLGEVRPSFAANRAPRGAVTPRREVAATTACAPAGLGNAPLEDDDPILAELKELESRHADLPPPFRTPGKRRRNQAPLLVTVTVILVAAGLYAAGTTQPSFRNLVRYEYAAALRHIAEFRTKPQAIVFATPAQPPPHAAQSAAAPLAPPSAAQRVEAADTTAANSDSTANPVSTSSAVADAKASPRAASLRDVKQDDGASSTAAVPALVPATSTTQRASSDTSSERVVLPENVADERVMRRVRPVYPKQAQQKRVHGAVVLQVVVNKEGKVDSMQVINGNPLLARAAMDAVRQRRYKPYFRDDEAVAFETQVTVDFRLP